MTFYMTSNPYLSATTDPGSISLSYTTYRRLTQEADACRAARLARAEAQSELERERTAHANTRAELAYAQKKAETAERNLTRSEQKLKDLRDVLKQTMGALLAEGHAKTRRFALGSRPDLRLLVEHGDKEVNFRVWRPEAPRPTPDGGDHTAAKANAKRALDRVMIAYYPTLGSRDREALVGMATNLAGAVAPVVNACTVDESVGRAG